MRSVEIRPSSTPLSNLLPLTSLRFFAAFYIMAAHVCQHFPAWLPPVGMPGWANRVFSLGFSLVGFFFLLSGFVLSCVYLDRPTAINKRRFFVARFARLYPLYVAAMVLDVPSWVRGVMNMHVSAVHWIAIITGNLLLLQAWFPAQLELINPPAWFLSAEAFYYVMFPFIGPLIWRLPRRKAVLLAVIMYAAGVVPALAMAMQGREGFRYYYNPLGHLNEFVLGILLAKYYLAKGPLAKKPTLRVRPLVPWFAFFCVALAMGAVLLPVKEYFALLQHGAIFPLEAVLVLIVCSGHKLIRQLTRPAWLTLAGEASYGLFLCHAPVLFWMQHEVEHYSWFSAVYVVACIGLSIVSLIYFEAPVRHRILEWYHTRAQETLMTASIS